MKASEVRRKAQDEIRYFYECLKVDTNVESMGIEELINYLESEKKLTNDHIELLAFVLKEQGEMEKDSGKQTDFFRKSYFLLKKVERESTSFSMDRQMKLALLKEYLN